MRRFMAVGLAVVGLGVGSPAWGALSDFHYSLMRFQSPSFGSFSAPAINAVSDIVYSAVAPGSTGKTQTLALLGDNDPFFYDPGRVIEQQVDIPQLRYSPPVFNDKHEVVYAFDMDIDEGEGVDPGPEVYRFVPTGAEDAFNNVHTAVDGSVLRGIDNMGRFLVQENYTVGGGDSFTRLNRYSSGGELMETILDTGVGFRDSDVTGFDFDSVSVNRGTGAVVYVEKLGTLHRDQIQIHEMGDGVNSSSWTFGSEEFKKFSQPYLNNRGQLAFIETDTDAEAAPNDTRIRLLDRDAPAATVRTVVDANSPFIEVPGSQFIQFNDLALDDRGNIGFHGDLSIAPMGRSAVAYYDDATGELDEVFRTGQLNLTFGAVEAMRWREDGLSPLGVFAITLFQGSSSAGPIVSVYRAMKGDPGLFPDDPVRPEDRSGKYRLTDKGEGNAVFMPIGKVTHTGVLPEGIDAVLLAGGGSYFEDDGPPIYVDPPATGGFLYEMIAGAEAFATVELPQQEVVGDSTLTLSFVGAMGKEISIEIVAGQRVRLTDYVAQGVKSFTVTGLEINIDPGEEEPEFVLGLTWVDTLGEDAVLSITPLAVPEPVSVVTAALCGLILSGRGCRRYDCGR